jgi:Lrp/AsnC family transcriptional regulator, leucine-responsive regulatory protein
MEIDQYDTNILKELQDEARLSMAELGRRVHLSQPAVTERVRKLETAGVITGYKATVDGAKLGYGIRAIVRIGRCDYPEVVKRIAKLPEVRTAYNVTGEDSWVIEIAVKDVAHLDVVLWHLSDLTETSTAVILRAVREFAPLLPPRDATDVPTGKLASKLKRA